MPKRKNPNKNKKYKKKNKKSLDIIKQIYNSSSSDNDSSDNDSSDNNLSNNDLSNNDLSNNYLDKDDYDDYDYYKDDYDYYKDDCKDDCNDDYNDDCNDDYNDDCKDDCNDDCKDDYNKNNKRKNNKKKNKKKNNKLLHIFFDLPPFINSPSRPPPLPPPEKDNKESFKVLVCNDNDYFKTDDKLYPIKCKIETLDDLIELAKTYDPKETKKYVINLKVLNRCLDTLIELNNMIGMEDIKKNIINLFFFYLQNFYGDEKKQMLHTIIEGTPGSGKTEVAKILAKLYYNLGIVRTNKFIIARRSDLIGKYLGHTAANTQDIFDKAENGVIFIDEAYSLGNKLGTDSFSKECIDTINQNLTEKKGKVIVIIAGYKKQLEESFFSYNPGLMRRFPFRYTINPYSAEDLMRIYLKMMKDDKWSQYDKSINVSFFEKNKQYFKYSGGDMEILWGFTKITHARRVFGMNIDKRKKIIQKDVDKAFELFVSNDEVKKRNDDIRKSIYSMYL